MLDENHEKHKKDTRAYERLNKFFLTRLKRLIRYLMLCSEFNHISVYNVSLLFITR